jgi:hypothetical protein
VATDLTKKTVMIINAMTMNSNVKDLQNVFPVIGNAISIQTVVTALTKTCLCVHQYIQNAIQALIFNAIIIDVLRKNFCVI